MSIAFNATSAIVEYALACSIDPSVSSRATVAQADGLRPEFLHFIGSRMFRGAGFQAG
jgi:hypothetical protein